MRNKYATIHVMKRDEMFYYVRHIPNDLTDIYSVKRLCFSLKTKSYSTAIRFAKSVSQRLDDYWFGISPEGFGSVAMVVNFVISYIVMKFTSPTPEKIKKIVDNIRIPEHE